MTKDNVMKTEKDKFEDIRKLPEMEIVQLLKREDCHAWDYVFCNAVLPVSQGQVKRGKTLARILHDRRIEVLELYGIIYEEMVYRKKLDLYCGKGSLLGWMKLYIFGLVLRYCRKNPWAVEKTVSDPEGEDVYNSGPQSDVHESAELTETFRNNFLELS